MALYLDSTNFKGVSTMKLRQETGIEQKTAVYMAYRIRKTRNDETAKFIAPVEVDKTCIAQRPVGKRLRYADMTLLYSCQPRVP